MDKFARHRNQASAFPWISILWDGWTFTETSSSEALTAGEASDAFERALALWNGGEIIVSKRSLPEAIEHWITRYGQVPSDALEPAFLQPDFAASATAEAPAPATEGTWVAIKILCAVLGVKTVGLDDDFYELGGHSVHAIRVLELVQEQTEVEIELKDFLANPTAKGLANLIDGKLVTTRTKNRFRLAKLSTMFDHLKDSIGL